MSTLKNVLMLLVMVTLLPVTSDASKSVLDKFVCRIAPKNCESIYTRIVNDRVPKSDDQHVRIYTTNEGPGDALELYIEGTSRGAIIRGFKYYLKHVCHVSIDHFGLITKEIVLRPLIKPISITLDSKILFYGNICTYSYSYWMWNWTIWEQHIDWIAMEGFNVVLVPTGMEGVLLQTFKSMKVPEDDILSFFNGPAYLAWSRMGNMKSFTSPLSVEFLDNQNALHEKIVNRFDELEIAVAAPGFSGFVPDYLTTIYDHAYFNDVSCWNGFNESYSCLKQLDPSKSLYHLTGKIYMKFLVQTFGTSKFYAIDMFNENTPKNTSKEYLKTCGKNTVSTMKSVDPSGKWLLQGWTFGYDPFWSNDNIEAYLSDVDQNDIVILDMFDKEERTWMTTDSYFHKPFIWSFVNNFGGNTVINGNILRILNDAEHAYNISQFALGFGFMPEGIHENTILLDAVMQYASERLIYDKNPKYFLEEWKNSVSRYRYNDYKGDLVKDIVNTFYLNELNHDGSGHYENNYIIYRRPDFNMNFMENSRQSDNLQLLNQFNEVIKNRNITTFNEVFLYDLSSILQNSAELVFYKFYRKIETSYAEKDLMSFHKYSDMMSAIILILDEVMIFVPSRSLSCYLEQVAKFALIVRGEKLKLCQDLKRQITIWGYNGEILDYAFKIWSGVLRFYQAQRWTTFFSHIEQSMKSDVPFDYDSYISSVSSVEENFVKETFPGVCFRWRENYIQVISVLIDQFVELVTVSEF